MLLRTVDWQVDPGAVDIIVFVGSVEKDDWTLVPAFVARLNVSQFDWCAFDQLHSTLKRSVDVWRETVELDKDRNLLRQPPRRSNYAVFRCVMSGSVET